MGGFIFLSLFYRRRHHHPSSSWCIFCLPCLFCFCVFVKKLSCSFSSAFFSSKIFFPRHFASNKKSRQNELTHTHNQHTTNNTNAANTQPTTTDATDTQQVLAQAGDQQWLTGSSSHIKWGSTVVVGSRLCPSWASAVVHRIKFSLKLGISRGSRVAACMVKAITNF